jgi:hypothetical protein
VNIVQRVRQLGDELRALADEGLRHSGASQITVAAAGFTVVGYVRRIRVEEAMLRVNLDLVARSNASDPSRPTGC